MRNCVKITIFGSQAFFLSSLYFTLNHIVKVNLPLTSKYMYISIYNIMPTSLNYSVDKCITSFPPWPPKPRKCFFSASVVCNHLAQLLGILRNPDRTRTRTRRKPGLGKNPDSCSDSHLRNPDSTIENPDSISKNTGFDETGF